MFTPRSARPLWRLFGCPVGAPHRGEPTNSARACRFVAEVRARADVPPL